MDKYLIALFFLSLQNEGAVSTRLRQLLFDRYRLVDGLSAESAERYHEASRLANRYCGWLEARYLRSAAAARPGPRGPALLAARPAGEARDDRGATLSRWTSPDPGPSPRSSARADRLRRAVDVACALLRQGRLTRAEAEAVVAATREQALALFPGKGDVFDLVLAPRFAAASSDEVLPAARSSPRPSVQRGSETGHGRRPSESRSGCT